ncbi:hypothetical protein BYT27DRAFT_7221783 [Phlegmacium glaucopus]|nr:hypothetical protein BYT27DRAFT_7221783 [Phlegmacium glaucopus]
MTGSAHDAAAFEHTTAAKYPNWFFADDEFAWADSAYGVNSRTIPVHKQPASLDPTNALFNKIVAHLHVHSEHCMGALKGQFQCLHGLHLTINSKREHNMACRWITIAIIFHNLIIDVEGQTFAAYFAQDHGQAEEEEDRGQVHEPLGAIQNSEAKQVELVAELMAFQEM